MVMAGATITFRLDASLKKDFEDTCKYLGLNPTTAFNIYVLKLVRECRIPFDVSADPFYSPSNIQRLKKGIAEFEKGEALTHDLIEE